MTDNISIDDGIPVVNMTAEVSLSDFLSRMHLVVQNFGTYWLMAQANPENPNRAELFPLTQTLVEWKDAFDEVFEAEDLIAPQNTVHLDLDCAGTQSEVLGIVKEKA